MKMSHLSFSLFCCLVFVTGCSTDDSDGKSYSGNNVDAGQSDVRVNDSFDNDLRNDPGTSGDTTAPDMGVPDQPVSQPDLGTGEPDEVTTACGYEGGPCCEQDCDGSMYCSGGICLGATSCPGTSACITPPNGTPDITITTLSGVEPTLQGGTLHRRAYELTLIEVYPDATFTELVTSVNVTSNGNTYGSVTFQDRDWGFNANLDMYIEVDTVIGPQPQAVAQNLTSNGCFSIRDNLLLGDLTECGGYWPEGSEPPESLEFEEVGENLQLLLIFPRDALIASIGDETIGDLAVAGDLPILFTFAPIQ